MTSSTEKLRRLLDERGVEYDVRNDFVTYVFFDDRAITFYSDIVDGEMESVSVAVDFPKPVLNGTVWLTPEQAVAVALGGTTWRNGYDQERRERWHGSLFHGEPSSFKELIEDVIWTTETVDLGPNGNECHGVDEGEVYTESMIATWAEKAAALGRGTMTAEDVRSFLTRNSLFDDVTWPHGRQELVFDEDDLQAMADELNATLGRGTCKHTRTFNLVKRECDGERYEWHGDELPKRCPNCGAEVVGADD